MVTAGTCVIPCFDCNIHVKGQFWEKNPVLSIEKCLSLVLPRNAIMLKHLIMQFLLYYQSSGRLQEVKNKRKFQTVSSKSGRSCLWEVVVYRGVQIQWFDLETFGNLENWLLWGRWSQSEVRLYYYSLNLYLYMYIYLVNQEEQS